MIRNGLAALYGLYAVVALVFVSAIVVAPVMMAMPTLTLRRRIGRWGVRLMLAAAFVPLRIRGLEHLPDGHCVVVSNHASYLDGPILTGVLPERFTFVVQHGAAAWPWYGWVIRRMGVRFVNRSRIREGARQTRGLIRVLQGGEALAVFAEGTFEDAPGLLAFRRGAFLMAAHADVPVVPAVIRGSRRLLGGGRRLPCWNPVEVELFKPITPEGNHREAITMLRDSARAVILRNCGEPDATAS